MVNMLATGRKSCDNHWKKDDSSFARNQFEPVEYSSNGSLFNDRYRNNFIRNLSAINIAHLKVSLGVIP